MRRIFLTLIIVLAVATLAAGPALAGASQQSGNYVVRRGDTLSSIAARNCITTQELYALNRHVIGPNPNAIYAGMVLTVPNRCGGTNPPGHGGVYDRGPQPHARGPVHGNVYTVVLGDTMFSVAARFGLTVHQLAAANGIGNPWWIYPGQRLIIPGLGGGHPPVQPCPPIGQPCPQPCPPAPQPCPTPCPTPPVCPSPTPIPKVFVTITSPVPGAVLPPTFEVRGMGGGLFEGNVVVTAFDNEGNKLAEKATTVQAPDAGTGGQGPWAVSLTVNVRAGTPGRIVASSPQSAGAPQQAVNVVYGAADGQVKEFPPGVCRFQAKTGAPYYTYHTGGTQAGTFPADGAWYEATQGVKVNGVAWYMFYLNPAARHLAYWTPVSSIALYYSTCVW
jgi:LysM repeat protein